MVEDYNDVISSFSYVSLRDRDLYLYVNILKYL